MMRSSKTTKFVRNKKLSQTYFLMILHTLSLTLLPPVFLKRSTWKQNARVRIMQDQKTKNTEIRHVSCSNVLTTSLKYGFILNFEFAKQSNCSSNLFTGTWIINFWNWSFPKLQLYWNLGVVTSKFYLFLLKFKLFSSTSF